MQKISKEHDLLVRISILEKMVDKLFDQVTDLQAHSKLTDKSIQGIASIVTNAPQQEADPWVEKQEFDKDGQPIVKAEPDDVDAFYS